MLDKYKSVNTNRNINTTLQEIYLMVSKKNNDWLLGEFNINYNRYKESMIILTNYLGENIKILDVGCYPGFLTLAIKKLGFNVYAVDLQPNGCLEELSEIIVKKCDLDKDDIPFENDIFDAIICTEVIEHLHPFRVNYVLNEFYRCLKPNGFLILSTPNLSALENRIFLVFGGINALGGGITPSHHTREYSKNEMLRFLTNSKFLVIETKYSMARDIITLIKSTASRDHIIVGIFKNPNWKNIGRFIMVTLKKIVPSFRSTIFVISQKKNNMNIEKG